MERVSGGTDKRQAQLAHQGRSERKAQLHLDLLCDAAEQFRGELSLHETINLTLDTLWRTEEIDQVAVVLGDHELGPFRYAGLRGIPHAQAFLDQECPLPLWGVLAQAVVHRPQESELDCLIIDDIAEEERPRPDEFPWMEHQGSMMILPLRSRQDTQGALVLASRRSHIFRAANLRRFIYALAAIASRSLREARTRAQLQHQMRCLLGLQLLTRKLTGARTINQTLQAAQAETSDLFGPTHLYLLSLDDSNGLLPTGAAQRRLPGRHGRPDILLFAPDRLPKNQDSLLWDPGLVEVMYWVLQADQPVFLDPTTELTSPQDLYYRDDGRAVLAPIEHNAQEISHHAVLFCAPERQDAFDEDDLIVIRTIANCLGLAVNAHPNEAAKPDARLLRRDVGGGDAAVNGKGGARHE